ncbi:hypothetical protein [Halorhabdus rudnickae]|uniref:hypothetical protein n=1 Tax=Halorhabdus rudnickae TaxID=1775544 RepID=UPI0010825487|nr:hypothetical protein [Halorhabdus rudnickae]
MGLREDIGPSLRAIRPALVVVTAAVVLVATAVTSAVGLGLVAITDNVTVAEIVGVPLMLVVTLPLLVALYAPLAGDRTGLTATLRQSWNAVRTQYRSLLVANSVALGVAVVAGIAAVLSWYVLATGLRLGMYVLVGSRFSSSLQILSELALAFWMGFGVGLLVTRFTDLFVVFEDANPWMAWRSSAGFARRHPSTFFGYALATIVLFRTATILLEYVTELWPDSELVAVTTITVIGGASTLLWVAVHVGYVRGTVSASVPDRGSVTPLPWKRVAIGIAVLSVAVAGAGVVRVADVGAGQAPIEPLSNDPEAAYSTAIENTAEANHRVVMTSRNRSANESFTLSLRTGVDADDRRMYLYMYDENGTSTVGGFMGEGTYATRFRGDAATDGSLEATIATGNWQVRQLPAYVPASEIPEIALLAPDADPQVSSSTDSTLVYRFNHPEAIGDAFQGDTTYQGSSGGFDDESTVKVVVDRERGTVGVVEATFRSRETGHAFDYRWQFQEVGTADIRRPEPVGSRKPMAWVWEAILY